MKPTFALSFTLLLLASCAIPVRTNYIIDEIPAAGVGFCNANKGVYVILVNYKGAKKEFACPDVNGSKTSQPSTPPAGLITQRSVELGVSTKLADESGDPCIQWIVGGRVSYICW